MPCDVNVKIQLLKSVFGLQIGASKPTLFFRITTSCKKHKSSTKTSGQQAQYELEEEKNSYKYSVVIYKWKKPIKISVVKMS
jgi:hypothetical protein